MKLEEWMCKNCEVDIWYMPVGRDEDTASCPYCGGSDQIVTTGRTLPVDEEGERICKSRK